MVVIDDRHGHISGGTFGKSTTDQGSQRTPQTRESWVTPAWERLETPMEVTMYAGQR
jgi:hypothetical protein